VIAPGRAVRVERVQLDMDCGGGYSTTADWYFPTETEPDKIMYFQQGRVRGPVRAGPVA
jgi:hypothetical protein